MRKLNWLAVVVFTLAFQCSSATIVGSGEYGWIDTTNGNEYAMSWDANSESRLDEMLNKGFVPMTFEFWNGPWIDSYNRVSAEVAEGDSSIFPVMTSYFPEIGYQEWMDFSQDKGALKNPSWSDDPPTSYLFQEGDRIFGFEEGFWLAEGYLLHYFAVLSENGEWSDYLGGGPLTTAAESPLWMVRVAAVPEPTTLGLFAAGLAGLGFSARRRKQAH